MAKKNQEQESVVEVPEVSTQPPNAADWDDSKAPKTMSVKEAQEVVNEWEGINGVDQPEELRVAKRVLREAEQKQAAQKAK